ncbi:PucR family transcriptional regulator [Pseudalkalibacillus caeni]|uniref:PucR C-terminal helix-turn-helix domain-containing protein n=1 Tax=Exobacillus caeni TaxID=2574798 RepID=A0A5R9F6Q3_9BACL|nr:helix-turn-helix domain-containing protein [Pseudalkalibacillus caeni]TLS38026.1 hypothetical protein FCL54_05635 [Pseudalkalibacillus caeni]
MLVDKLKHLYSQDVVQALPKNPEDYLWIKTGDGEPIGIRKSRLTNQEETLLRTLYPGEPPHGALDEEQSKWSLFLYGRKTDGLQIEEIDAVRFIHFDMKEASLDHSSFEEAMQGAFPFPFLTVWENERKGVIIQQEEADYEDETDSIIAALTADFYNELSLYIGQELDEIKSFSEFLRQFDLEQKWFEIARESLPKKVVYHHYDMLPYVIYHDTSAETLAYLTGLLESVKTEKELLYSIKVYLENNMNISVASKKLFIHRNSLQYRVEKFIERTGIDVKTFKGALLVYLAILARDMRA